MEHTPVSTLRGEGELQDIEAIAQEIGRIAATINAANHRLIMLIGEMERRGGYTNPLEPGCFRSCAHWLSHRIGLDLGAAREHVRVARALPELSRISEAFQRGVISYSKVRAITRVASPENEEYLLGFAKEGSAAQVETLVRKYRRANRVLENERAVRHQEERALTYHYDESGMLVLKARLPPEEGALVLKALEAIRDDLYREERASLKREPGENISCKPEPEHDVPAETEMGTEAAAETEAETETEAVTETETETALSAIPPALPRIPERQRSADALVEMATRALTAKAGSGTCDDRYLVVVHIDAEVLASPEADGRSELEDGPSIAPDSVRWLLSHSAFRPMWHGPKGELTPGRKSRFFSGPMRRALAARDGTRCVVPGCPCRGKDAHHVRSWLEGGPTSLSNGLITCKYHHSLIHCGTLRVEATDSGGWRFFDRHGQELVQAPPLPAVDGDAESILVENWLAEDVKITPYTGESTWDGEPVDYTWAVEDLLGRAGLL